MKRFWSLLFMVVVMAGSPVHSQIPNAGFEHWTVGDPDNWATNNAVGLYTPVTQSTDAHSGSFALKGEVVNFFSIPISPILISGDSLRGFPLQSRPAVMEGFYKFNPIQDDLLAVSVMLYHNGMGVATGNLLISAPATVYTPFSVDLDYFSPELPDTVFIQFIILDTLSGDTDVGTYFLLDDLAFSGTVGIADAPVSGLIDQFALHQNYPNPFNPTTTISYVIPAESDVSLRVYNSAGQEVARLVERKRQGAGNYTVTWNAADLPSGTYFCRLVTGDQSSVRKMMLVK